MRPEFEFIKSGLKVEFKNLSTGDPDSYVWKFGDGNQSAEKNPEHNYQELGLYLVELTIVKGEDSISLRRYVAVNPDEELLLIDQPLKEIIKTYIPEAIIEPEEMDRDIPLTIRKWQLFLQPLVEHELSIKDVHKQSAFSALENYLIAQLVARDYILNSANKYLSQFNKSMLTESGDTKQELRALKTGPSEAQWYSSSELWGEIMKQDTGSLAMLTSSICTLAHRLRITFHFCVKLSHSPVIPRHYKKPKIKPPNPFEKHRL